MSWLRTSSTSSCFGLNCNGNCKLKGVFLALLGLWVLALPAYAKYGGGSGTAEDPYQISTPADMNAIGADSSDWDKHFKLTADIDLSGYTGTQFNIIGNTTTNFTGVFNGNFHTISNFTYSSSGTNNVGIFGVAGGSYDMDIRDLGLDNPNVNAGTGDNVGALVGQLLSKGYVLHCSVAGGSVSGNNNVGGIMGYGNQYARIYNSCSTVSVSGTDCVGGLMGKSTNRGRIDECYSAGSVSGTTNSGGLLGLEDGAVYSTGTVIDSFWDTQTSGQATSAGGGTGRTTAQMQDVNTFLNAGWDFVGYTTNGVGDIWAEPAGGGYPVLWWQLSPLPPLPSFSGGSGTFGDPYLISTAAHLNSIGGNPRLMLAHFKLTDNIDLTGVDLWPIGFGYYDYPFSGTFDGNDHTISDFTYNVPGSYSAGIFAAIDGPNAVVKDLGIIDPDIVARGNIGTLACAVYNGTISNCYMESGNISGGYSLGGLIGIVENGTISDCYVRGASIYGDRFRIGGLVGVVEAGTISGCYTTSCSVSGYHGAGGLAGDVEPDVTVTNCYSDSSVYGAYGYGSLDDCSGLGGLIGYNSGTVSNCHATGAVSGIVGAGSGGYFGGLIAMNSGTVSACYATGNISEGHFAMGGLVGSNAGCNTSYGTISDCYATGNVTGIEWLGGLAGSNGGTITNSRAEGDVTSTSTGATDWSVGGLVGHNEGIIDQSYAIGAVSGYNRVGGLAGTNAVDNMCEVTGIISDCYAMGSVSGNDKVGGLVGYQYFMSPLIPAISRCYSTGSVSGTTDVGGLIGKNNNGTVTASFWDEQTSGQTTSDGGTRKTTAEMQTQTTFTDAGWDFVHIWDVCEGINYPKLIWQIPLLGDFVYPDGVNMLDLAFLAAHWLDEDCNDLNGYCEGADLNRSGDVNFPDYGLFAQNWRKGLMPFVLDEDFETGDFTKYNWQQAGDANWVVVGDVVYEGSYSAKSGLISHNEESVLQISLIIEDGSVSFYRKVSSESDEDYLRFYIDDDLQDSWSGEQDWSLQQYAITSGLHTLKWVYMKDASISSGSDCAWIDKITVTGVMP